MLPANVIKSGVVAHSLTRSSEENASLILQPMGQSPLVDLFIILVVQLLNLGVNLAGHIDTSYIN